MVSIEKLMMIHLFILLISLNGQTQLQSYQGQNKYENIANKNIPDIKPDWIQYYGSGNLPGYNIPTAILSDIHGDIYVTGYSSGVPFSLDIYTIKYNGNGKLLWETRYNGNLGGDDIASSMATDNAGNIYVTGWTQNKETGYDFITVKYSPEGDQMWVAQYADTGSSYD